MAKLDRALQVKIMELHIATSERIAGPAMLGVRRQTLLLPPGFAARLSEDELHALLGHELAHVRRCDFAKNLFYGLVSLPVAYHPLLWLTRARLAETRELVCDAMAVGAAGGEGNYARSLLRLAAILSGISNRAEPGIMHAVGIFDANNFERRVMRLTEKQLPIGGARRVFITAACLLVAFSACASALAWRVDVNAPPQKTVKRIAVAEKYLTLLHEVRPVYPPEAKKARIDGSVVLAVSIAADGTVHATHVVSGPVPLRASAMDAVKQWKYRPYLLNGDPIAVDTQVTVVYSLPAK
jgi:TonB family protein